MSSWSSKLQLSYRFSNQIRISCPQDVCTTQHNFHDCAILTCRHYKVTS
jgi:hypothetical protein